MDHLLDHNTDPVLHHSPNKQPTRQKRPKMLKPVLLPRLPNKLLLSLPHRPLKLPNKPRQSSLPNKPRLPWLVYFYD